MELGTPELILILAIVILIFGVGRIGKIGAEMGQGLRAFREGLSGPKEVKESMPNNMGTAIPKTSPPDEK